MLYIAVAPCGGAWVEILAVFAILVAVVVAPCGGAWVEILIMTEFRPKNAVAPCGGAWVEIYKDGFTIEYAATSRPARARGLKFWFY